MRPIDAGLNPLDSKDNYSATSNNTKLVHWPLTGGLLHLVQRGAYVGCGPAQSPPRCTKCNSPTINGRCTNHCGPLLCGFNVAIKGLTVKTPALDSYYCELTSSTLVDRTRCCRVHAVTVASVLGPAVHSLRLRCRKRRSYISSSTQRRRTHSPSISVPWGTFLSFTTYWFWLQQL